MKWSQSSDNISSSVFPGVPDSFQKYPWIDQTEIGLLCCLPLPKCPKTETVSLMETSGTPSNFQVHWNVSLWINIYLMICLPRRSREANEDSVAGLPFQMFCRTGEWSSMKLEAVPVWPSDRWLPIPSWSSNKPVGVFEQSERCKMIDVVWPFDLPINPAHWTRELSFALEKPHPSLFYILLYGNAFFYSVTANSTGNILKLFSHSLWIKILSVLWNTNNWLRQHSTLHSNHIEWCSGFGNA